MPRNSLSCLLVVKISLSRPRFAKGTDLLEPEEILDMKPIGSPITMTLIEQTTLDLGLAGLAPLSATEVEVSVDGTKRAYYVDGLPTVLGPVGHEVFIEKPQRLKVHRHNRMIFQNYGRPYEVNLQFYTA